MEKQTVLWLDDDAAQLEILGDQLRAMDVEIVYASSVAEGLAKGKERGEFAALILDAILPLFRRTTYQEAENREEAAQHISRRLQELEGCGGNEAGWERSLGELERGGLRFQKLAEDEGLRFGKTVMVSFVPGNTLRGMGYHFDLHIGKLALPENLAKLVHTIAG